MAITFANDSATIGTTEYFLASDSTTPTYQTTVCIVQLFLDLSALTSSEEYQLNFYEKVNGGTARLVERWAIQGSQLRPHFATPSTVVGEGWEFGVKKIAGTDRAIPWSIRRVA